MLKIIGTSGHLLRHDSTIEEKEDIKRAIDLFFKDVLSGRYGTEVGISCGGAASGWDLEIMERCIIEQIPLILRLPFLSLPPKYQYTSYARKSSGVVSYQQNGFTTTGDKLIDNKPLFERNIKIVKDAVSSKIFAVFWDGRKTGGSYFTLNEARKNKKIKIINYYEILHKMREDKPLF